MMERSLQQERKYWDDRIGEVMRDIQMAKELAEEFRKLHDRIYSVEPASPMAGKAQRDVLQFCINRQVQVQSQLEKLDDKLEQLKAERP
jgi:hypothetical protein